VIGIRQAQEEDINVICSFDHMAKDNKGSRRKFIVESVKKKLCYVAEVDGKAVGYTVLNYTFYSNGMIEMLYVHPEYRRQGVGTELIKYVESICKTEKLFTSTNQSNLPMQGIMSKMGYVPSGFIDNLDEGDPEIVYFKKLKRSR
jgi:GNAT superfamily N-acetyltransferase